MTKPPDTRLSGGQEETLFSDGLGRCEGELMTYLYAPSTTRRKARAAARGLGHDLPPIRRGDTVVWCRNCDASVKLFYADGDWQIREPYDAHICGRR